MTSVPVTQAGADGRLSAPPKTRARALAAVGFAIALLLAAGTLGGAMLSSAPPDSTTNVIGWLVSTAGVVAAGIVAWIAIRSLLHSLRAARQMRDGQVLEARASAASSIHDGFVAFGIGVAVLLLIVCAVGLTTNDAAIQRVFLRWDIIADSAKDIVVAFGLNIWIAVVAQVFVLIFGLVLAVLRLIPGTAGRPVRALAIAYIDVLRAVPAIIVIYLVGFGLPLLDLPVLSGLSPASFAIIALTLTYSAYVAETYRAGIEVIHPSQWSAARSIGLSYPQTLRFVILPQAIKGVIPPLLSSFISLQKDTALVNIIGALDAFNQAKFYSSSSFNLSPITVVAVLFIVITIPQTRLVDWLLERSANRRLSRQGK